VVKRYLPWQRWRLSIVELHAFGIPAPQVPFVEKATRGCAQNYVIRPVRLEELLGPDIRGKSVLVSGASSLDQTRQILRLQPKRFVDRMQELVNAEVKDLISWNAKAMKSALVCS